MKKDLLRMVNAIINDDANTAEKHLHEHLTQRLRNEFIVEMPDMEKKDMDYEDMDDDDMDDDMDDDDMDDDMDHDKKDSCDDDMDYDMKDKKSKDMDDEDMDYDDEKSMNEMKDMSKKDMDYDKKDKKSKDMKDMDCDSKDKKDEKDKKDMDEKEMMEEMEKMFPSSYKSHNAGELYKKVPHKDNSRSYKNPAKGKRKGLKKVVDGVQSPDSDGKKDNRRTDKSRKYHGKSRMGKAY